MKEFDVKFRVTEQDIRSLMAIRDQVISAKDQCFLSMGELIFLSTVVDAFEKYLYTEQQTENSNLINEGL